MRPATAARAAGIGAVALAAILALQLGSCASGGRSHEGSSGGGQAGPEALTRDAAASRSHQIMRMSYHLQISVDATAKDFQGKTTVRFELKPKARDAGRRVFLDFEDGDIQSLLINGKAVTDLASTRPDRKFNPDRYDGHRIWLELSELKASGQNQLEIAYTHPYSQNGDGFYRFTDPVDQRAYVFTDFEPYNAHRLFPCFDQPDIKASYEVTAEAPSDWTVISNMREKQVSDAGEKRKSWYFPPSPVFSTYLFALHAGPYASWKSVAGDIPLRLFARKSIAQYVEWREWFDVTRKGLEFYALQFGIPYPFFKYDQIIVPDFNPGAMENPGAVTFNETMVYRSRVTTDRRRNRAAVILHEMAHMWFGDLVTMRWWNGLWLNESFATFMSMWATDKTTSFPGTWQSFFGQKIGAYWEDQLVTTHPVDMPVPDTDHAMASFDSITYGKGAAALKQLKFLLGEDDFREGLQRYFAKFSYRNTTLADFIKMLSEASSKDLSRWQRSWLQTTGVNTVRAEWECAVSEETGRQAITKLALLQSPESELRPHRAQVGLFYFPRGQNKQYAPLKTVAEKPLVVTYSKGRTEVEDAVGEACPDFVFPNLGDEDYVKVELDPVSLKTVSKHLAQIEDAFTRQMVWHTLWEMVVDGKLRAQDYADIALSQGAAEKDTQIVSLITNTLAQSSVKRSSALQYMDPELQKKYQPRIEAFYKRKLQSAPAGSDLQLIWFQAYVSQASGRAGQRTVRGILDGSVALAGFERSQERRWDLIQALARMGAKGASDLIDAELEKDATDMGMKQAIQARAALPELEEKQAWYERFVRGAIQLPPLPKEEDGEEAQATGAPAPAAQASATPSAQAPSPGPSPEASPTEKPVVYNLAKLRQAMWTFNLRGQEEFVRRFAPHYFEALPILASRPGTEDREYAARFAGGLFPSLCEKAIVDKTTELLDKNPNLPAPVIKSLRISRQMEERCIRAREKSKQE